VLLGEPAVPCQPKAIICDYAGLTYFLSVQAKAGERVKAEGWSVFKKTIAAAARGRAGTPLPAEARRVRALLPSFRLDQFLNRSKR